MLRRALGLTSAVLALAGCAKTPSVEIGAVLPLSGPAKAYGESIQRGLELAFEQLPPREQLRFDVTVRTEDSGSDPARGAEALARMFSAGVFAAVGGVTSDEALAMAPVADRAGRVLVSPSASSPALSGISNSFYRICPDAREEARILAVHVLEEQAIPELAVVYQDDALGRGFVAAFRDSYGGQLTPAEGTVFAVGAEDLAGVVEAVATARARARQEGRRFGVLVVALGDDLVHVVRSLRRAAPEDRLFTTSALANRVVLSALGEDAEQVRFTQTAFDLARPDEWLASFAESYELRYGSPPDYYAAHGFDALNVLVSAMRSAGARAPAELRKGMIALDNLPAATGTIRFREDNDVQKYARISLVLDGAIVPYERYRADQEKALREEKARVQAELDDLLEELQEEE
ncbi:MAG TPA: ABC transporter substrate-binding protein [Thermoanaerobaculia bacterium]|nr:ABC transporter substrate-binding protein [Thermoanaerobaculia bacterium]